MTTGTGIAIAAWFLAFVWANSIGSNTAAGVVIFGAIIAAFRLGLMEYIVDEWERNRKHTAHDRPSEPPERDS